MAVVSMLGRMSFGMETFLTSISSNAIETVVLFTFPGELMAEEDREMKSLACQMNLIQDKTKFVSTRSLTEALSDASIVVIGLSFPVSKNSLTAMKRFLKSVLIEVKRLKRNPTLLFRDEIRGIVYGSLSVKLMELEEIDYQIEVLAVSGLVYSGTRVFGQEKQNAALWPSMNEDIVIQDGVNADKFEEAPIDISDQRKAIIEGKAVSMAVKATLAMTRENDVFEKIRIIGRRPTEPEALDLDIAGGISFMPVAEDEIPNDGSVRMSIKGIHKHTTDCLLLIDM